MNKSIHFVVFGKVFTKQYRVNVKKIYKSKLTKEYETAIWLTAKNYMQRNHLRPLSGAISLKLMIYIYNKKNVNPDGSMKSIYCTIKPDTTDILKSVEDAVKNVCFGDDCVVVHQENTKYFCSLSKDERVEITISNIKQSSPVE